MAESEPHTRSSGSNRDPTGRPPTHTLTNSSPFARRSATAPIRSTADHYWSIMTVNAVTACCRFFSDSGAVLGAPITTGRVRRSWHIRTNERLAAQEATTSKLTEASEPAMGHTITTNITLRSRTTSRQHMVTRTDAEMRASPSQSPLLPARLWAPAQA